MQQWVKFPARVRQLSESESFVAFKNKQTMAEFWNITIIVLVSLTDGRSGLMFTEEIMSYTARAREHKTLHEL